MVAANDNSLWPLSMVKLLMQDVADLQWVHPLTYHDAAYSLFYIMAMRCRICNPQVLVFGPGQAEENLRLIRKIEHGAGIT